MNEARLTEWRSADLKMVKNDARQWQKGNFANAAKEDSGRNIATNEDEDQV